jgi:hypothetical protein
LSDMTSPRALCHSSIVTGLRQTMDKHTSVACFCKFLLCSSWASDAVVLRWQRVAVLTRVQAVVPKPADRPPLQCVCSCSNLGRTGGRSMSDMGVFYWTVLAPDVVNLEREEQVF